MKQVSLISVENEKNCWYDENIKSTSDRRCAFSISFAQLIMFNMGLEYENFRQSFKGDPKPGLTPLEILSLNFNLSWYIVVLNLILEVHLSHEAYPLAN